MLEGSRCRSGNPVPDSSSPRGLSRWIIETSLPGAAARGATVLRTGAAKTSTLRSVGPREARPWVAWRGHGDRSWHTPARDVAVVAFSTSAINVVPHQSRLLAEVSDLEPAVLGPVRHSLLTLCVTCEPSWRGPCASTGRDRLDRQVHALVRWHASGLLHQTKPITNAKLKPQHFIFSQRTAVGDGPT